MRTLIGSRFRRRRYRFVRAGDYFLYTKALCLSSNLLLWYKFGRTTNEEIDVQLGLYEYDEIRVHHPFTSSRTILEFVQEAGDIKLGMIAVNMLRLPGAVSDHLRLGICGSLMNIEWLRKQDESNDWDQPYTIGSDHGDHFHVRHTKGITLWLGRENAQLAFCLHTWDFFREFGSLTPQLFWEKIARTLSNWRDHQEDYWAITECASGIPSISPEFTRHREQALALRFRELLDRVYEQFFLYPVDF